MALDAVVTERLKAWLLSNVSAAGLDPEDMTEYVVSLVNDEGSREELYAKCIKELGEFLGPQTQEFVDRLFAQIDALVRGTANEAATAVSQQPQQQQQQQQQPQQLEQQLEQQQQQPQPAGQTEFRKNFRSNGFAQSEQPGFGTPPANAFQPSFKPNNAAQFSGNGSQMPANMPANMPQMPNMPPNMPNMPGMPQMPNMPGMPPMPNGMNFPFMPMPPFGFNQQKPRNFKPRNHRRNEFSSVQNELGNINRKLIVENIPAEKLDEGSIREYFGKFGDVQNVRIDANNKFAELEYATHEHALAAHKSSEAVFGNRFVKVFWRRKTDDQPSEEDHEAIRRMQAIKQAQFEEKEARRKQIVVELKEMLAQQSSVLERRQSLLQAKASGSMAPSDEELAQLAVKCDQLGSELTKLKTELTAIQGTPTHTKPVRGTFRGRGRATARSRPYSSSHGFASASIDRRPKGVLLNGVSPEQDEQLRGRLAASNYSDYVRRDESSVVIDFPDRKSAESFFQAIPGIEELKSVQKQYVRLDDSNAMDM